MLKINKSRVLIGRKQSWTCNKGRMLIITWTRSQKFWWIIRTSRWTSWDQKASAGPLFISVEKWWLHCVGCSLSSILLCWTLSRVCAADVLRLKAVSVGVVVIKGERSGRYLAMNSSGRLYGSVRFKHMFPNPNTAQISLHSENNLPKTVTLKEHYVVINETDLNKQTVLRWRHIDDMIYLYLRDPSQCFL